MTNENIAVDDAVVYKDVNVSQNGLDLLNNGTGAGNENSQLSCGFFKADKRPVVGNTYTVRFTGPPPNHTKYNLQMVCEISDEYSRFKKR